MRLICFLFFTFFSFQTALATSGSVDIVFMDLHEKESLEISFDENIDAVTSNRQSYEELDFEDKTSFQYFHHNNFSQSHILDVQTPPPKAV